LIHVFIQERGTTTGEHYITRIDTWIMPKGQIKMNTPPPPQQTFGVPGKSEKYKGVKHTILVMSGKGGVGKSTVAINLAISLGSLNRKVGIIDADINGPDDPKMLGVDKEQLYATDKGIIPLDTKYGVSIISMAFLLQTDDTPVIWRGALRHKAVQQFLEDVSWEDMDYVVMDFPPGTGDEALSVAQLVPDAEGVVIVATPQDVALLDVRKAINFAGQLKLKVLGIVENMSGLKCPHCGQDIDLFGSGGAENLSKKLNIDFLGKIPFIPEIVSNADSGIPGVAVNKVFSDAFENIAKKIIDKVEKK
jgi:ATP-binding protein involved in chromosome partitioning